MQFVSCSSSFRLDSACPAVFSKREEIVCTALAALENHFQSIALRPARPCSTQRRTRCKRRDVCQSIDLELLARKARSISSGHNNALNTGTVKDTAQYPARVLGDLTSKIIAGAVCRNCVSGSRGTIQHHAAISRQSIRCRTNRSAHHCFTIVAVSKCPRVQPNRCKSILICGRDL